MRASAANLLQSVKCSEPVFMETGYSNWRKAAGRTGRFESHQTSTCHILATKALYNLQQSKPVTTLLSQQISADQNIAQKCLKVIFTTIGYLARQGLALRGHDDDEGNFTQLLRVQSLDVPEVRSWLERSTSRYTHHSIQDEMLQLYGDATLRRILDSARRSQSFAVIVDSTQDIQRTEQESICIRWVDDDIEPHEDFVGFYAVNATTGVELAKCVKDCLIRYQLPLESLRAQTYDGASNMSGAYNGCQAIIAQTQPLASYVHCSAHCSALVASAACLASPMVRDSLQLVNEFGVLCNASGKFKLLFANIASCDHDSDCASTAPVRNIKPLCPTRWLVRLPAVNATLNQYELILKTLEDAQSSCSSEVSARAASLLRRFQDPATVMSLTVARNVIEPLESLNRSVQSERMTVAGMIEATRTVKTHLQNIREEIKFDEVFAAVESTVKELELEALSLPRRRRPPARYTGPAEEYQPNNTREYFRVEYVKMIDVALQQLDLRILQCPGLLRYQELEAVLMSGQVTGVVSNYPELTSGGRGGECRSLQTELDMFRTLPAVKDKPASLDAYARVLRSMLPDMRAMFTYVEALIRLLIVTPASSATAERSFSGSRRLKTYLRSTCGQRRLNDIAVCHVHKDVLDAVDVQQLMREFILKRDSRAAVFGHILV